MSSSMCRTTGGHCVSSTASLRWAVGAVILVPVDGDTTLEAPEVTSPSERLRVFGHEGHVRKYGKDWVERVRQTGFIVEVAGAEDVALPDEIVGMGLANSGEIYHCRK